MIIVMLDVRLSMKLYVRVSLRVGLIDKIKVDVIVAYGICIRATITQMLVLVLN